ncbi:uncharacterized protein LOC126893324 [Diabrotica virgifera virgifera]|uniref:Uncharacterized protein LOC114341658 n=1 Tax=Diabrotica virgifera virgifera TaxID=50390 RepID=A0A6P7GF88_DIAVI|nr:uncharacterized protein LOC126893324 [Diabrotica virgifera virgifera]
MEPSVEHIEPVTPESVDELRLRLQNMRKLMEDRIGTPIYNEERRVGVGVIDGNFLSITFGVALVVIISVSVYAFYNLYLAILKKFSDTHDEL